ncbi:MAG TPA: (Fe-S)-binding protein [Dokdonella sp.]
MKSMLEASPASAAADPRLASLTDQCVMCGLCLPHCPTYRLENVEAESPRGRIALARALTTGTLAATATAVVHLDHCLGCLSCQKVCPSQVQYEEILVRTRAALADAPRPDPALPHFVQRILRNPRAATAAARWGARLRLGRWLPPLARRLPLGTRWRRLAEAQPDLPAKARFAWPAPATRRRGRIGLFRGCVASVYDRDTLAAAKRLLEALGYEVVETPEAACCGALERHHGDVAAAARSAAVTRSAIESSGVDTVLVAASGCHGDLRGQVLSGHAVRVEDVHAFVAADPALAGLRFHALPQRAALHLPCTQVNNVGAVGAVGSLLARIPQLAVVTLPEQPRCCGAAGSYFLEQPDFAARLRDEKLAQTRALAPDLLLTTNIGCRIHLGNGLRGRDPLLRVIHPLALLAEQLDNSTL